MTSNCLDCGVTMKLGSRFAKDFIATEIQKQDYFEQDEKPVNIMPLCSACRVKRRKEMYPD
ncbi:MAG: hypothetical protein WCF23_16505 [Candidatus Nitrosopolaris sp.]